MFEEPRSLPDKILPPSYSRGRKHVEPVGVKISVHETGNRIKRIRVSIDTEEGQVDPGEFFSWLVGRNAFTVCEGRGELDSLFRILNVDQLRALVKFGVVIHKGIVIRVYGRDGSISVREGNKWGRLNNVVRLSEGLELETPTDFRKVVQLANMKLQNDGFKNFSLRSLGQTI